MRKRKNKKGAPPKKGKRPNQTKKGSAPLKTGRPQVTVIPGVGFDTDAERVKLRFTDSLLLKTGVATSLASQGYGINTPREPDRAGSSGVAQGWSSMIAKYAAYVCYGSRIRWSITASTARGVTPAVSAVNMVVLYPIPFGGTMISSNITDAKVQKYSKYHVFPEWTGSVNPTGTPKQEWKGSHSMTVAKIDGESDLRNSNYEAATSADPTRFSQWMFQWQDLLADTNSEQEFLFEVEIVYDVLFFRRLVQVNALGSGMPRLRTALKPAARPGQETEQKSPPSPEGPDTVVVEPPTRSGLRGALKAMRALDLDRSPSGGPPGQTEALLSYARALMRSPP